MEMHLNAILLCTQTSAAVILPRPGHKFGPDGVQAPSRIAPVKQRQLTAEESTAAAAATEPTSGSASGVDTSGQATGLRQPPPTSSSSLPGAGGMAAKPDSGGLNSVFNAHARWTRAVIKLVKRRVMVTRFRLNQEAYRHRLGGGSVKMAHPVEGGSGAQEAVRPDTSKSDFKGQMQSMVAVKSNLIRCV